jgi:hypothetical protein
LNPQSSNTKVVPKYLEHTLANLRNFLKRLTRSWRRFPRDSAMRHWRFGDVTTAYP